MCDKKSEEEKDMALPKEQILEKKESLDMKKIDAILKRGIKRYDKALAKLAKN